LRLRRHIVARLAASERLRRTLRRCNRLGLLPLDEDAPGLTGENSSVPTCPHKWAFSLHAEGRRIVWLRLVTVAYH